MKVTVSGLPGKMATAVAKTICRHDEPAFELASFGLTGPEISDTYFTSLRSSVKLIPPQNIGMHLSEIKRCFRGGDIFAVDYTQPKAAVDNARFYCKHGVPFVMGTTGGDRGEIDKMVARSGISAVIAPNMAAQIVAFQAAMEFMAQNFPEAFEGFALFITESHQEGKADTSGTAKAVMASLEKLGLNTVGKLRMIRKPEEQLVMGVPPEHINGHGWHNYRLASRDGSMAFRFVHNVNGRLPYAAGTLKALAFLEKKMKEGSRGQVFSMIDVLKG